MENNWLDIFRLKRFDFVVVEVKSNKERQRLSQKHKSSWDKNFFTILPENFEVDTFQPNDYVKKYGTILKSFMASEDKEVLITDQLILGAIVKGEQKDNFLNFIVKRRKKIVIVAEPGTADLFEKNKENVYVLDENIFIQKTEFEKSVQVIKQRISEVYTPFSNPVITYQKMKTDGVKRF